MNNQIKSGDKIWEYWVLFNIPGNQFVRQGGDPRNRPTEFTSEQRALDLVKGLKTSNDYKAVKVDVKIS